MHNSKNRLIKLIEIIRKDTGINNFIDAMEQLTLLLLLKYICENMLENKEQNIKWSFLEVIFENAYHYRLDLSHSFHKDLFVKAIAIINNGEYCDNKKTILNNITYLAHETPFRIKSNKVFDHLIQRIDTLRFDDDFLQEYSDLLAVMAIESKSSGAFYTPKALVSSIIKVSSPTHNQSIYDPTIGTGGFIVEAHKQLGVSSTGKEKQPSLVFGRDISPFACLISIFNFLINQIDIKNIYINDSLTYHDERKFDLVLSNPPFGKLKDTDKSKYWNSYSNEPCIYSRIEAMFIRHIMQKLATGGKAVVIVPQGILFDRQKEIVGLRKELLEKFNLHTILSLPSGALSPYTSVKANALFFDNTEPDDDIWFYRLQTERPLNKTNQLESHHFEEFIKQYSIREEGNNSSIVHKSDILNSEDLSLLIDLPEDADEKSQYDVIDEISLLKRCSSSYNELLSKFTGTLEQPHSVNNSKKVLISDIFKTKSGKTISKDSIKEKGNYPVYGANGIIGYCNEYNLEGENILIGRVGANCGNVHYVNGPILLTNNSFSVQLHNNDFKIHLPYLAHVLRTIDFNQFARGVAQPSISYAKIKDLQIDLPSYEQQVELSAWFDDIQSQRDKLIDLLKSQSEKISELASFSISNNSLK